jgi:hypothetical protein
METDHERLSLFTLVAGTIYLCFSRYEPLVTGQAMSQGTGLRPLARFLLTSLAFHGKTMHAKTKIARNGAGSPTYATCMK